ncbi:hypothetical protein JCM11251_004525 [Rhodosporidiobolus azoricus]
MSDAGSPPPGAGLGGKRRKRSQVDTSLIIEEPRKRKRREGSTDPAGGPSLLAPHARARAPEEFEEVRQRGTILYDKLVAQTDPYDSSRPLWYAFADLPSAEEFPDYYEKIKKPMSFNQIKERLDNLAYVCLLDVKTDLNQIFVNAKRYNAPKSAVFMDAKRLHKTLKETYAILTGEAPPPEDDDNDGMPTSAAPASDDIQALDGPARRAAVLKPWLSKKLNELMQLKDEDGRERSGFFLVLPDKHNYPDYYDVIANPLAFDVISSRINKRAYSTVEKFVEDVNTIFSNAFEYNEDTSLVCHDAAALRTYFAQIMQEPPPIEASARRPAAPKRSQRSSSALPVGEEDDFEADDSYHSPYGASPAAGSPAMVSNGYTPTTTTIGLPSLAAIPEAGALAANPLAALASLAGSAALNGAPGASALGVRPLASRVASDGVVYPRTVVKLPSVGEVSLVTSFDLTFHSSSSSSPETSLPSISHLDTSTIRQHSVALPVSIERITFTPIFRSSANFLPNGKGKGTASSAANGVLDAEPTVTTRIRPSSVSVQEIVVPSSSGETVSTTKRAFALAPGRGLNVVEFVVKPAHADLSVSGDGAVGEEVYRVFLTK